MFSGVRVIRSIAAAACVVAAVSCEDPAVPKDSDPATETYAASLNVDLSQMTRVNNALYIQDKVVGTGAEAASGDSLTVTYTGWLVDGKVFGSTAGGGAFGFTLGRQEVIAGWDAGLVGIQAGGTRRLIIGSRLGYGGNGAGCEPHLDPNIPTCIVPADATLIYEVKAISVK